MTQSTRFARSDYLSQRDERPDVVVVESFAQQCEGLKQEFAHITEHVDGKMAA